MVGTYQISGNDPGFRYDGSTYTTFHHSLSTGATIPYDIDGTNIVGRVDTSSGIKGFVYDGTSYNTLDVAGVQSISGTTLIGTYIGSTVHGFIAVPGTPEPSGLGVLCFVGLSLLRRR